MSQIVTMLNAKMFLFLMMARAFFVTSPDSTHHIRNVQDLAGHGIFVMAGCGGEPEFLECFIHQFLHWKTCCTCQLNVKK